MPTESVVLMSALVFTSMFATDLMYGLYIRRSAQGRALQAAAASAAIMTSGGIVTLAYVHDPRYLVVAIAGAFAGTYAVIRWDTR